MHNIRSLKHYKTVVRTSAKYILISRITVSILLRCWVSLVRQNLPFFRYHLWKEMTEKPRNCSIHKKTHNLAWYKNHKISILNFLPEYKHNKIISTSINKSNNINKECGSLHCEATGLLNRLSELLVKSLVTVVRG